MDARMVKMAALSGLVRGKRKDEDEDEDEDIQYKVPPGYKAKSSLGSDIAKGLKKGRS
jgi:hypothetical protein